MIPLPRLKGLPQPWVISGEAPPWAGRIPPPSGLYMMGATPPPIIFSSHPPPVLLTASGWQLSCEPFLPLVRLPFKPEPTPHQWELHSPAPDRPVQPSSGVDLVPLFHNAYGSMLHPPFGKRWLEKRIPAYQVYLNAALTFDSTWISPEEMRIFQWHGKPLLMTNQVAVNIFRPPEASRNVHNLCGSPQHVSGCPISIKRVGSNKRIALAASAMVGMESPASHEPPSFSTQPLHLLTLAPIRNPVWPPPGSGDCRLTPKQVDMVTSLCPPAMKFMATNWISQPLPDKSLEMRTAPCARRLDLGAKRKAVSSRSRNREHPLEIPMEVGSIQKDKRPVASTHVPGSPWCVVWTGDDRVFFFNPTMQLSVWEKPMDLKGRGDLNRIIKDPPHKRKKDYSTGEDANTIFTDDESGEQMTKRNKKDEPEKSNKEKEEEALCGSISPGRSMLPLEVRISHFRDMLLERGVSAFSTWEKELHKIVFDPRYLLLSSDERKQIFEQFVKMRIKEEYKEKRSKLHQAKEEFRKLLENCRITPRSTFKEFSEKYGKDQRFKLVPKKKDQEHFFNQFINVLRKRDKENRLRLKKMR